jgi:D-beta-D-heptose 7-phosphate kinase/D-beta-D-heptose 1-phosphate adenosyltransferase
MALRKPAELSSAKVLSLEALARAVRRAKAAGKRTVFTNGCFDLLHPGHIRVLEKAKALGDVLIVGVNSDRSARLLNKAPGRPVVSQADRALVVAALRSVSFVVIFDEPTPLRVIQRLLPDVLVKGADWGSAAIVGADAVRRAGGRIVRIPLVKGRSTTRLVERIRAGKSALDGF